MSSDGAIKSSRSPGGHTDKGGGRNLIVESARRYPMGIRSRRTPSQGGFPFLIDDDTDEVLEPAFLFLVDAYVTKTGFWNWNTTKRAAYDLLDWWQFLDHQGRPWDLADGADLDAYRDSMIGEISPRKMSNYPLRPRKRQRTRRIDFTKRIRIVK